MSQQAVRLNLPDGLYERIRTVAKSSHRSVESVMTDSLALLFGEPDTLPAEEALDDYPDEELWALAYRRLTWPEDARLQELTALGKRVPLTKDEQAEAEALLDRLDDLILLRSRALWLLQQRGHDIKSYLKPGA